MEARMEAFGKRIESYPEAEKRKILDALEWGVKLHEGQSRASGEPYFVHPLEVADILVEMRMDSDTIAAGLLHDILEDTPCTRDELRSRFGGEVELLVEGVTKISILKAKDKTNQQAETIRKMFFAMTKDIRVILIKLADKLNNMRTLKHLPDGDQKRISAECLDIFAPLAERLGISWMKDELEDLSFKYLNRDAFDQIKAIVASKKGERSDFLDQVESAIREAAASAGIKIEVESRAKHFYSIYQKMRKRNKSLDELYDLLGIRIYCEEQNDCYSLLGIVHQLWRPIDGRFKDYIAMPKANGYRSLHTTVMCNEGRLLEIQIRTYEMHRMAEFGVASHWLYKKGAREAVKPDDLPIINRLRSWIDIRFTSGEFLEEIKRELLKDSIFIFTPKGDAIELPSGATPIDFAFAIHSDVGIRCIAAKADGVIIPLDSELKNTQVIEIMTSAQAHPHIGWLRTVRTAKARSKIRAWLIQNDHALAIERNIVAKRKLEASQTERHRLAAIGKLPETRAESESRADQGPRGRAEKETEPIVEVRTHGAEGQKVGSRLGFSIAGEKNLMIKIAGCCKPSAGDSIIGYISRGRGIIVHKKTCRNVLNIPDVHERMIEVEWESNSPFMTKRFRITARRSTDLFSEIEGAVKKFKGHLIEGRLEDAGKGRFTGFFTMEFEGKDEVRKVVASIRNIPNVINIQTIV